MWNIGSGGGWLNVESGSVLELHVLSVKFDVNLKLLLKIKSVVKNVTDFFHCIEPFFFFYSFLFIVVFMTKFWSSVKVNSDSFC